MDSSVCRHAWNNLICGGRPQGLEKISNASFDLSPASHFAVRLQLLSFMRCLRSPKANVNNQRSVYPVVDDSCVLSRKEIYGSRNRAQYSRKITHGHSHEVSGSSEKLRNTLFKQDTSHANCPQIKIQFYLISCNLSRF